MKSYIKGIAVFKDGSLDGKRFIQLDRGLNIISGNSKTGKSAIMDIIDWCLCSDQCTIPRGVISHFANIYSLILSVEERSILLAREDQQKGKNSIYVKEIDNSITIDNIKFDDFSKGYFFNRKDALSRINDFINLKDGEGIIDLNFDYKIPKTDLRDTLPYMLQYQEIVANKSKLFYIEPEPKCFPVLAGWYGADYYINIGLSDRLKKEIKILVDQFNDAQKINKALVDNLINSLKLYFNLVGKEYNENWTLENVVAIISKIEEFKREITNNNLVERQSYLEKQIETLSIQKINIGTKFEAIRNQQSNGNNYNSFIKRYKERTDVFKVKIDYTCPICKNSIPKLTNEALQIIDADKWLKNELTSFPNEITKFDNEKILLDVEKKRLINELDILIKEFKTNQAIIEKITKDKNLNEQKQLALWKVKSDLEIYNGRKINFDEKRLSAKKADFESLVERLKTYKDIKQKYIEEKIKIEKRMSLIIEKLDFEHKPPELNFDLNYNNKEDCFKLYHNSLSDERIFLRQMGSASNALACHLGLFLSLMNYFATQENSKVPSILFFDQPSQVYFPSGADNTDIDKVSQIYETILDEIEEIEKMCGYTPQIIVADHVKDMGEDNVKLYEHYFKADWRDGRAFI